MERSGARVRIGELARRTGVSTELLRAWEQRYEVLRPERSPGGFRLYSTGDEQRVRRMTALIASGVSASEAAARAVRDDPIELGAAATEELAVALRSAIDRFDGPAAEDALDRLFATVSIEIAITDVLVPYLHELGDRWKAGSASVGQEHFASNLLRARLLALARGWGNGSGPAYVLACPSDEEHDIGLIMFGIALARRGARVVFLGADTPVGTIAETVADIAPAGVVVAAARVEPIRAAAAELSSIARDVPIYLSSGAADHAISERIGARLLEGDPVAAARALTGA